MKINFKANYCNQNSDVKIYNKNLSGEFIDVSISKNPKKLNFNEDVIDYTKKDKDDKIILNFKSFTLKYFIKELFNIVFTFTNIEKNEKRLNRLLILCLIDAYIKNNFMIDENFKNYINKLIKLLEDKCEQLEEDKKLKGGVTINNDSKQLDIDLKYNNKSIFNKKISLNNNENINNNTENILDINKFEGFEYFYNSLMELNYENFDNYNDLFNTIKSVIKILKNLLEISNVQNDKNIIYNVTQLGGMNKELKDKYLKYKAKYLLLKK
jgi:hypothetical protein